MLELIAIIVVLALLIYQPSLNGPPIWDDLSALDAAVRAGKMPIRWHHLRSLTRASWAATFRVATGRLDGPVLHHLVSVAIHIAVAVAVVPIARALDANEVVVALVVVAHPLAVSSVAAVGQRASALSTLFIVLAADASLLIGAAIGPVGWLAGLPFVVAALMSKEDALGLVGLIGLAHSVFRDHWRSATQSRHLAAAGQPASLPFRQHVPVALLSSLARLPGWVIGIRFDVLYDAVAVRVGRSSLAPAAISTIISALITTLLYIQGGAWGWIAAAFWLSPFVLYWFIPLPHPVVDSRAYSLTVLVGLAVGNLPLDNWAATALVSYFAIQSARLSWRHESAERYWKSSRSSNEVVQINLAASLQSIGRLDEADSILQTLVEKNPSSGIGWANLGLIAEARARHLYMIATQEAARLGRPGPAWPPFVSTMQAACGLLERGRAHCPSDQTVLFYHQKVHQLARELGVREASGPPPTTTHAKELQT